MHRHRGSAFKRTLRWVFHRKQIDRLPRRDMRQNSGGDKPPNPVMYFEDNRASALLAWASVSIDLKPLTFAFDLPLPPTKGNPDDRQTQEPRPLELKRIPRQPRRTPTRQPTLLHMRQARNRSRSPTRIRQRRHT